MQLYAIKITTVVLFLPNRVDLQCVTGTVSSWRTFDVSPLQYLYNPNYEPMIIVNNVQLSLGEKINDNFPSTSMKKFLSSDISYWALWSSDTYILIFSTREHKGISELTFLLLVSIDMAIYNSLTYWATHTLYHTELRLQTRHTHTYMKENEYE